MDVGLPFFYVNILNLLSIHNTSIRNEPYIYNIGSNAYEAHGAIDEKERMNNFASFASTVIPAAPVEAQGEKILGNALNRILTNIQNKGTQQVANLVKIIGIEDDVMMFSAKIGNETVEGITNFAIEDGKLLLNQLHLQGSSVGNVGREALWNMAKDLGRQYNVKEVVIQGGKRTTGKYKGKIPSPITIKVD